MLINSWSYVKQPDIIPYLSLFSLIPMPVDDPGKVLEKGPETYSLITYAWVFGLAMLGGMVSFLRKLKSDRPKAWSFLEFLGEIATSAFAGVITFYLCQANSVSQLLTAAFVGVSGHMGSRALIHIERIFTKHFPKDSDDESKP